MPEKSEGHDDQLAVCQFLVNCIELGLGICRDDGRNGEKISFPARRVLSSVVTNASGLS